MDDYIETKTGETISEIFAASGEAYFRDLEKKYLLEVSLLTNTVIALGGGTPCFNRNMEVVKATGISIFLETAPTVILERLVKETEHRPLLQGKSQAELTAFITQKLAARLPFYQQADYSINSETDDVLGFIGKIR